MWVQGPAARALSLYIRWTHDQAGRRQPLDDCSTWSSPGSGQLRGSGPSVDVLADSVGGAFRLSLVSGRHPRKVKHALRILRAADRDFPTLPQPATSTAAPSASSVTRGTPPDKPNGIIG